MSSLYVGECSVCGQGRQLVCITVPDRIFFFACEECESDWASLEQLQDGSASLWRNFPLSRLASAEEVRDQPWHAAVVNQADLFEDD